MCVAQRNSGGEERVLLFLKLNEPDEGLSPDLKKKIQASIRARLSARHVPALILPIREVPYTVSGKKVEVAVRQVIHNEKVVNKGSLSNPDALDHYANIPELAGW
ncbi:UNVERIFIED_CONTAM: hypothetical protein GTU68_026222 [Idotea baltica]|nr:hypothetical protein [Idotea baltica]